MDRSLKRPNHISREPTRPVYVHPWNFAHIFYNVYTMFSENLVPSCRAEQAGWLEYVRTEIGAQTHSVKQLVRNNQYISSQSQMSVENAFKIIPHILFSAQNYSKAVGSLWGWQRTEMRLAGARLDPAGAYMISPHSRNTSFKISAKAPRSPTEFHVQATGICCNGVRRFIP